MTNRAHRRLISKELKDEMKKATDVFQTFIEMPNAQKIMNYREFATKIKANEWDWWIPCSYYSEERPNKINTMGNCYSLGRKSDVDFIYENQWMGFKKENPFPFFDTVEDIFAFIMKESPINK